MVVGRTARTTVPARGVRSIAARARHLNCVALRMRGSGTTRQSTRTPKGVPPLRGSGLSSVAGHFYVIRRSEGSDARMLRAFGFATSIAQSLVSLHSRSHSFAGGRSPHSGKSKCWHPGKGLPRSSAKLLHAMAFAPRPPQVVGGASLGRVGLPPSVRQTMRMCPKAFRPPHNLSVNSDACGRLLPSVAPFPGRQLRSR